METAHDALIFKYNYNCDLAVYLYFFACSSFAFFWYISMILWGRQWSTLISYIRFYVISLREISSSGNFGKNTLVSYIRFYVISLWKISPHVVILMRGNFAAWKFCSVEFSPSAILVLISIIKNVGSGFIKKIK